MIVITGGAGFIGSNLAAALQDKNVGLAVVDRLGTSEKWRNVAKRELVALLAPDQLFPYLDANARAVDCVFHMGAISSTVETAADLIVQTNFTLSQRLWAWCAERRVRLIYASSAATYGDGSAGFDDDMSAEALARLRPLNLYGWSKHVFDRWVSRQVSRGHPRPPQWAGLKFFNVYGPNEYHKAGQRSVAHQFYEQVRESGTATLFRSHNPEFPDGGQRRDFVWVDDVVDMMVWLYEQPHVSGLFNAGSGKARSFGELALAVFAALGLPPRLAYVDTPESLRPNYQYFTEARMDRLRVAGFPLAPTPLETGVAHYVTDYLLAVDPFR